jgi:hypothetical protein
MSRHLTPGVAFHFHVVFTPSHSALAEKIGRGSQACSWVLIFAKYKWLSAKG